MSDPRPFHVGTQALYRIPGYEAWSVTVLACVGKTVFFTWEDVAAIYGDHAKLQSKDKLTHLDGAPLGKWEPVSVETVLRLSEFPETFTENLNAILRGEA
jgi:hypothetical protein